MNLVTLSRPVCSHRFLNILQLTQCGLDIADISADDAPDGIEDALLVPKENVQLALQRPDLCVKSGGLLEIQASLAPGQPGAVNLSRHSKAWVLNRGGILALVTG